MSKAAVTEKTATKGKDDDSNLFRETFQPKSSHVNFGALKNEKREPQKKKKGPAKKIILILALVLVLLAGGGAAAYYTGYLTPILERFGLAQTQAASDGDTGQSQSLVEQKANLDSREQELNDREETLNQRELKLAQAETATGNLDTSSDGQSFRDKLANLSDEELADLKKVSAIYNNMNPKQAATIMVSMYDTTKIAAIIYYMRPAVAAQVLEQMEMKTAADVTALLVN